MTLGERINLIRKESGLTLEKFGERIDLKKSALSQYEHDTASPSDRTIRSICRVFGVNEEWLRDGIGEMHTPDVLDDIIKEQGLEGEAAELTKRFARVFASLRPETQHELLTNFDRYFNPPDLVPAVAPSKSKPPTRDQEAERVGESIKDEIRNGGEKVPESGTPPAGAGTA